MMTLQKVPRKRELIQPHLPTNTNLLYYHNNGHTKMVAQSPAALEYYNFWSQPIGGLKPFPKGARAPPPDDNLRAHKRIPIIASQIAKSSNHMSTCMYSPGVIDWGLGSQRICRWIGFDLDRAGAWGMRMRN